MSSGRAASWRLDGGVKGVAAAAAAALASALLAISGSPSSAAATGDANESNCGNEASPGFRIYLPDCRAYELVSPTYTEGFSATTSEFSTDGTQTIATSAGAFDESSQLSFIAEPDVYDLKRTETGWTSQPLDPQAQLFPGSEYQYASADLGSTLWDLHTTTQSVFTNDLFVRGPDGAFVRVGPAFPPTATVGPLGSELQNIGGSHMRLAASADLTHILFAIKASTETGASDLWPGDTTTGTGAESLYEYVGTGASTPHLVGVTGGAGSTALISNCGTSLGSGMGKSMYNAVSNSGARVVFTAVECEGSPPVNELFVREGGSRTVAVSEPSPADCVLCKTASPRPAIFEGASGDGAKVFFESEQELLPGTKGANLYEYDFDGPSGEKITLVTNPGATAQVQGVARVSEDGSHVYFVAKGVLGEANAEGTSPTNGADNLYVFERDGQHPNGHISFIATLLSEEEEANIREEGKQECSALTTIEAIERCEEEFDERIGRDREAWAETDSRRVQATPDGRFLVFTSSIDLTRDDKSTAPQLFEYDAQTAELVRLSSGQRSVQFPNGYNNDGNTNSLAHSPTIAVANYGFSDLPAQAETSAAVSGDGSRVVFQSAAALTPQAANSAQGCTNVYAYESRGGITRGNVYMISDGQDLSSIQGETCGASQAAIDSAGNTILFATGSALVPQDTNTEGDIYAARVGGGFPAPSVPPACEGEGCQGAPAAPPVFGTPSSATFNGPGNLTPPTPVPVKPKTAAQIRAQKLAKALKACRAKHNKHKRKACEKQARKRYGPTKAKMASHTTTTRKGGK
jgi:hypothetical protein